ncbi:putative transmembrane protein [Lysobacter dokdonensis DS-58]|uniref:Putative transmembrane protein n=1 Tax=Lysobacter dokdonensis DS-58 TaxID=1300345 RepID=A0A0A2WHC9_9GAMM|nr:DUF3999 domain-containing protein [Lysobacter dokdonensis]KGQ19606.1 putative transmembrane protein [Lysobacter dokdonensis DS-58]
MRRWVGLIALLPALAVAQVRTDYAREWSIALPDADAGAYRVELDGNVYRAIASPSLRDIDVVDAKGNAVAADVFGPDAPLASPPRFAAVPWFVVRAPRGEDDGGLALIARRDTTGRILSLEAQASPPNGAAPRAFLFDLSRWPDGVEALIFDFAMNADVQAAFRVETSDDLQVWRTLHPRLQLLDLQQAGSRLAKNDVPLGMAVKYVRLVPLGDDAFAFDAVRARIGMPESEQTWAWETLPQARDGRDHGKVAYEFESPGRFPVERADVIAGGNAAVEWRLESRDDDDAPWTWRAGPWVAFRVGARDGATASAPASIGGAPVRDRHWRLVAQTGTPSAPPALKLGYRPEVVVFLAQGTPPYSLVAGSARAARGDAPLPSLVDAMRASKGESWQPMRATLGEAKELAGDAALERPTTPEDWKQWLLWALLVVGAAVVAGFAIVLLRRPGPPPSRE